MTSTDVATTADQGGTLALAPEQDRFTPSQVAVLQQLGVEGASDGDLAVFFHVAQRTGLDPFAKQIYMIGRYDSRKRRQVQTIQTGIDGYRLVARRVADREGLRLVISRPTWYGPDEAPHLIWNTKRDGAPAAAEVTVTRGDDEFTAVALWDEYVQTTQDGSPTAMWRTRSAHQLAKCAEALALRMAFPHDLGGVRVEEELQHMDGARVIEQTTEQPVAGPDRLRAAIRPAPAPEPADVTELEEAGDELVTAAQVTQIRTGLDDLGVLDDSQFAYIAGVIKRPFDRANAGTLTAAEAVDVLTSIQYDREHPGGAA